MEISLTERSQNNLNRIVIITGANSGIGYETALELAKKGDHIIMACRDMNRTKIAADKIKTESKNNKISIEELDLSDFSSIRDFANRIQQKYDTLDVLINSASVTMCPYWKTKDGFEMHFGVNYLGHFLLTNLLLDLLKRSAPSRIINLSSRLYKSGIINWDDLNFKQNYDSMKAYTQSKLANVMFTVELAEQLKGSGVTAVCMDPGFVRSYIGRNLNGFYGCLANTLRPMLWFIAHDAKHGAETIVYCTQMRDIENFSGSYFSSLKLKQISNKAKDPLELRKLWDLTVDLVQLNDAIYE